jgi:hypothetical protein
MAMFKNQIPIVWRLSVQAVHKIPKLSFGGKQQTGVMS